MDYIKLFLILIFVLLIAAISIVLYLKQGIAGRTGQSDERTHGRRKLVSKKPIGSGYLSKIIETRIKNGVEESRKMAKGIEDQLVHEFSELTVYDDDERGKIISLELAFLSKYIDTYCDIDEFSSTKNAIPDFVKKMHLVVQNTSIKYKDLYGFIFEFHGLIYNSDYSFQYIIEKLNEVDFSISDDSAIEKLQLTPVFHAIFNLKQSIGENFQSLVNNKPKENQKGIERLTDTIRDAENDLGKAIKTQEVLICKKIFDDFLKKIKRFEAKQIQHPEFEVSLIEPKKQIVVKGNKKTLKFQIQNKNHNNFPISEIQIRPVTYSNDFRYEGSTGKKIDLSSGNSIESFVFNTYYYSDEEFDKNPKIDFKIFYKINRKKHNKTEIIFLPDVHPEFQIKNPFDEGLSGKGLKGESELFYGREELLGKISSNFLDFKISPIYFILKGAARSGKSSILNQLASNSKWLKDRYVAISTNSESVSTIDQYFADLFRDIERAFIEAFNIRFTKEEIKQFKSGISNDQKYGAVVYLLSEGYEKLKKENKLEKGRKKILLLVDEYQGLDLWDELNSEESIRIVKESSYQFPKFIKVLKDHHDEIINVVLAGYVDLDATYSKHWVKELGGRLHHLEIDNFSKYETSYFAEYNFKKYHLVFDKKGLELLWLYTSGHPWTLVSLFYQLFEIIMRDKVPGIDKSITLENIHEAVGKIRFSDLRFLWHDDWIEKDINTKLILAYLGNETFRKSFEKEPNLSLIPKFNTHEIKEQLSKYKDIEIDLSVIEDAINNLIERGLLLKNNDNSVQIRYPIFGRFCKKQELLSQVINSYNKMHQ